MQSRLRTRQPQARPRAPLLPARSPPQLSPLLTMSLPLLHIVAEMLLKSPRYYTRQSRNCVYHNRAKEQVPSLVPAHQVRIRCKFSSRISTVSHIYTFCEWIALALRSRSLRCAKLTPAVLHRCSTGRTRLALAENSITKELLNIVDSFVHGFHLEQVILAGQKMTELAQFLCAFENNTSADRQWVFHTMRSLFERFVGDNRQNLTTLHVLLVSVSRMLLCAR